MDKYSMDAGLRLLRTRRDLEPYEQALWLQYFLLDNPNRGAQKHPTNKAEIDELVRAYNAREVK